MGSDTFQDVGGFAVDLVRENDFEFAYRVDRAGAEFRFVPDGAVTEHRGQDWRGMVVEVEQRGRIAIDLYHRHPEMIEKMEIGGYDAPSGTGSAAPRPAGHAASAAAAGACGDGAAARPVGAGGVCRGLGLRLLAGREGRLRSPARRSLKRGVLILNYHAFAADGEHPSRYVVTARRFARQMAILKRCG